MLATVKINDSAKTALSGYNGYTFNAKVAFLIDGEKDYEKQTAFLILDEESNTISAKSKDWPFDWIPSNLLSEIKFIEEVK